MTKSTIKCGFGHIYWKTSLLENFIFCAVRLAGINYRYLFQSKVLINLFNFWKIILKSFTLCIFVWCNKIKGLDFSSMVKWGYQNSFEPDYFFYENISRTQKAPKRKTNDFHPIRSFVPAKNCCLSCLVFAWFCYVG